MKKLTSFALTIASMSISAAIFAAPVNINTASADEIAQALNGIGDAKAQAIVERRNTEGPFKSADDLSRVKGIGTKTVEQNRADIRL
jgi:competence protein ComEA